MRKIILFAKKFLKALRVFISRVFADGGIIEARNYVNSVLKTVGDASLVLIPSAYKSGVLYSILPEDGTGDFTFSRASGATRVNSQGLIEEVSLLGDELIVNGTFDTNTDWVQVGTEVFIQNGVLNINSTQIGSNTQRVYQLGVYEAGKTYSVSVENNTNAVINIKVGTVTPNSFDIGISTQLITPLSTESISIWASQAGQIGSIDNVSVVEVFEEGIPRIDYTDGTPVLLTEPQSTNLITYSEDFSQWINGNMSLTGSEIGLDG